MPEETKLHSMKQAREAALNAAEAIIKLAETGNRGMTETENADAGTKIAEAKDWTERIRATEARNTLLTQFRNDPDFRAKSLGEAPKKPNVARAAGAENVPQLTADYLSAFHNYLGTGGAVLNAALYEGQNSLGGYAVPITVDNQVVALAPPETALRRFATVMPTTMDIRVPRQTAVSAVSGKAESGATTNTFAETGPVIDEFTLSAFMAGAYIKMSFELAQDAPAFQSFAVSDLLTAQQTYEEGLYVSGSGVGEAQGFLGNIGAGVTEEPDAQGNLVSIDGTLDLIGSLNSKYHANASFLMNRLTSVIIRKAQRQANLFEPVWTSSNGVDYLHGCPVGYAAAMPTAARGTTPIVFGDWKAGYTIGDRGGSAITVKVLDQPLAMVGQIALLAYRRTDGRVRRSEALQGYTVAAS